MMKRFLSLPALAISIVLTASGVLNTPANAQSDTTVSALARKTHFHGIAVDRRDSSRLYLATHHGLHVVSPDGKARLVSNNRDDYMGFSPHPTKPLVLYASGHPATGGNMGIIASLDGGKTWAKLSNGNGGPVDFHQMDVSKADPRIIYGAWGDIQKSTSGGLSWARVGPAPKGLIDLAASSKSGDTLYAATQTGLKRSTDGGKTWQPAYIVKRPVTMVQVTSQGDVYAFVFGVGLIRAKEPGLTWQSVNTGIRGYVLHLAADPNDAKTLYIVTIIPKPRTQNILVSRDGGKTWAPLASR